MRLIVFASMAADRFGKRSSIWLAGEIGDRGRLRLRAQAR
jgi:hypothetical protein